MEEAILREAPQHRQSDGVPFVDISTRPKQLPRCKITARSGYHIQEPCAPKMIQLGAAISTPAAAILKKTTYKAQGCFLPGEM
ncbi:hypothetical protein E4U60_007259 [Claviceps pazoutovae]|uniref:Uncharacterized protein n=1 Tax=Claviceps pazoutovae TaxID=1649127 RepID=A0A9P7SJR2_9HYPO|nr:hypothetical protein E4U60_007259 [Claviceps pazoutovae]